MHHRLLAALAVALASHALRPTIAAAQCPPTAPTVLPPGGVAWAVNEGASTTINASGGGPLFEWDTECNGLTPGAGDTIGASAFNFTAHERDGSSSSRICVRSFNPACGAGAQRSAAAEAVVNVRNVAPAIATSLLAAGIEGTMYRFGLAATDPANPPNATLVRDAMTWSATGLPSGLSVDPMTGVISGVPAMGSAGTHTVTVTANDGDGGIASRALRLGIGSASSVAACPTPALATGADGAFTVAEGTNATVRATADASACGCAIVWDLGCDGAIDGSGATFALSAEGRDGPTDSRRLCAVNVPQVGSPPGSVCRASAVAMAPVAFENVAPTITTMSLPAGVLGSPYLAQLTAFDPANPPISRGFLDPITWSATGLPPGLALDTSTGVIVGTPDATALARCYSVTITARDDEGAPDRATLDLCLSGTALMRCPNASSAEPRYSINEGSTGTLSAAFSPPTACGCTVEWDIDCDGVPDGRGGSITFDARGRDGFVAARACWVGVPSLIGPCNAPGETQEVVVNVPNVSPSFVSTGLGDASEGVRFVRELEVSDPANPPASPRVLDPITFALTGAPAWLSVDPALGILSGTPPPGTGGMSFTFTVIIEDGDGGRSTAMMTLRVLPTSRPDAGPDAGPDVTETDAAADVLTRDAVEPDSASLDSSSDAATVTDAQTLADAARAEDAAAADATVAMDASPQRFTLSGDGACSCRAAGRPLPGKPNTALFAFVALASVAVARRDRRRR